MNLDLLGQDVITDLFTVLTMVWALAKHAFVSNDTHREVINCDTMVLTAHYLWCHVSGRARRIL